jgi:hypothetical protein
MATSFLGTRPSRRRRLCAPHELCTLQASQTWSCYGSGAMAIFDVSSMGESRSLSCRVGWRRCYGPPRWRAYLIIRERHTAERPQGASALRGLRWTLLGAACMVLAHVAWWLLNRGKERKRGQARLNSNGWAATRGQAPRQAEGAEARERGFG